MFYEPFSTPQALFVKVTVMDAPVSSDADQIFVVDNPNWDNTIIPNCFLHDKRLSWKVKGVLSFILYKTSKDKNWTPTISNLIEYAQDGVKSTRAALLELQKLGYFFRLQVKSKKTGKVVKHVYLASGDADFLNDIIKSCTASGGELNQNQVLHRDTPETASGGELNQNQVLHRTVLYNNYNNIFDIPNHYIYLPRTKTNKEITQSCKEVKKEEITEEVPQSCKEVKTGSKSKKKFNKSSIEYSLAELLLTCILENFPDYKYNEAQLKSWSAIFDLMLRRDERSPDKVANVIEWCQQDSFWYQNILSAGKLRKQYNTLAVQMTAQKDQPRRKILAKSPIIKVEPSQELIQSVLDEWRLCLYRDVLPEEVKGLKKKFPEEYEHFRIAASCVAALYQTNYFGSTKGLIRGMMMELTYEYLDKEKPVHTSYLTSKKLWLELMPKQVCGSLSKKEYLNVIQFP